MKDKSSIYKMTENIMEFYNTFKCIGKDEHKCFSAHYNKES